jgi:hypothetical protein
LIDWRLMPTLALFQLCHGIVCFSFFFFIFEYFKDWIKANIHCDHWPQMTPAIYSQQQLTWWSLQISHHMPWVYNFLYHFHPKVKKITTCKCKTYFTWIQTKIETYLITWDKSRFNSIFKIFKYEEKKWKTNYAMT